RQLPRRAIGGKRLAIDDLRGGLAPFLAMEMQQHPGVQLHWRLHGAAVRVDDERLANLREARAGLKAGHQNWNVDRHPRTAPKCGRRIHILHSHWPSCEECWEPPGNGVSRPDYVTAKSARFLRLGSAVRNRRKAHAVTDFGNYGPPGAPQPNPPQRQNRVRPLTR